MPRFEKLPNSSVQPFHLCIKSATRKSEIQLLITFQQLTLSAILLFKSSKKSIHSSVSAGTLFLPTHVQFLIIHYLSWSHGDIDNTNIIFHAEISNFKVLKHSSRESVAAMLRLDMPNKIDIDLRNLLKKTNLPKHLQIEYKPQTHSQHSHAHIPYIAIYVG